MKSFAYSVAIRTLGTAGNKYLQTLKSIQSQTIQPKKIVIYIAEGYPIPKESIGKEEYIYVKKGMVAQRALPYKEIETEYILCLDDDLFFPPDMVSKLYEGLKKYNADCISPNIFPNHKATLRKKIFNAWGAFTFPMKSKKWAFRIRKNASYSYNNNPTLDIYPSQSAAFACFLCKLSVFKAIHYEDEIWLDQVKYALGDDFLFFYKLYKNGFKLLVHFNTNIQHLDGKCGHSKTPIEKEIAAGKIDYLLWHRTCYNFLGTTLFYKMQYAWSFTLKVLCKLSYKIIIRTLQGFPFSFIYYLQGLWQGYSYTKTSDYKKIPNFKIK